MGYGFWKSKVRAHNQHPNEMFQQHLNGGKYKKCTSHLVHKVLK